MIRKRHEQKQNQQQWLLCCSNYRCSSSHFHLSFRSNTSIMMLMLFLLFFITMNDTTTFVVEAKEVEEQIQWQPNEKDIKNDGSGPLPLSLQQRQQLLKLDDTIQKSKDPMQTLQHIAQQNSMDPQELFNMLQRNRNDMQQTQQVTGGSGGGNRGMGQQQQRPPILSFFIHMITILGTTLNRAVMKYPKRFVFFVTSSFLFFYCHIQIPRTGLLLLSSTSIIPVLSTTSRSLFLSNVPTTLFLPPTSFIRQHHESFFDPNHHHHHSFFTKKKKESDTNHHPVWFLYEQFQQSIVQQQQPLSDGITEHKIPLLSSSSTTTSSTKVKSKDKNHKKEIKSKKNKQQQEQQQQQVPPLRMAHTSQMTLHVRDFLTPPPSPKNKKKQYSNKNKKKNQNLHDDDDDVNDTEEVDAEVEEEYLMGLIMENANKMVSSNGQEDITDWVSSLLSSSSSTGGDDQQQRRTATTPIRTTAPSDTTTTTTITKTKTITIPYMKLITIADNDDDNDDDHDDVEDSVSTGSTALLVVQGLGDYHRYGILPVQTRIRTQYHHFNNNIEDDTDTFKDNTDKDDNNDMDSSSSIIDCVSMIISTLPEHSNYGNIHICITIEPAKQQQQQHHHQQQQKQGAAVVVRVHLLDNGSRRSLSRTMIHQIIYGLNVSILKSLRIRTQVSISRMNQSNHYYQRSSTFASTKKQIRSHIVQQLENMASDRRRKWQRSNPNSGQYRPSGERMRNPNSAIKHY